MKLNDRYSLEIVMTAVSDDNIPLDIFNDFQKIKMERPFLKHKFGFVVIDSETGHIPDGCHKWNDSPEEAVSNWQEFLVHQKEKSGESTFDSNRLTEKSYISCVWDEEGIYIDVNYSDEPGGDNYSQIYSNMLEPYMDSDILTEDDWDIAFQIASKLADVYNLRIITDKKRK